MIRRNANSQPALPFGPFLSFGALCYLFFGEQLIEWYLGLL
jgi:leader peptidase (prepilin peptidase)/N-methyltransferase